MTANGGGNGEESEGPESLLTRRELLGASAALGTAAIASTTGAVGSASAQTSSEPRIALGSDYAIDDSPDGNGDLVVEHLPSGEQFRFDASVGEWNTGSISAGSVSVGEEMSFDRSDYNPHPTRSFEQSGPPSVRPHPQVSNPVATASDVTDRTNVRFVADPFINEVNGTYYLFAEVYHDDDGDGTDEGDISVWTSPDGLAYNYYGTVLDETFHLSWPYTFKFAGTWYMVPSHPRSELRVYTTTESNFPGGWTLEDNPSFSHEVSDPVMVYWEGNWYAWIYDNSTPALRLYYSDSLVGGSWTEHPSSPISTSDAKQRGGGRPIVRDDCIDLMIQDASEGGADKVGCHRVTELSTDSYTDAEVATSPLVQSAYNGQWNDDGMHHVDALMGYVGGNDVVIVDGRDPNGDWSVGVFTIGQNNPITRSYLSADTTIPSASWSKVPLDALSHDTPQSFDATNNEYVAPTSGYYEMRYSVQILPGGANPFFAASRVKNVTTGGVLSYQSGHVEQDSSFTIQTVTDGWVNEGDSIVFETYQDSGGSITINSGEQATYVGIKRIR